VSKHTKVLELRAEARNSASLGNPNFIQWLSMSSYHKLYYYIAVDKVGTDPRWVECGPACVQEHNAHYVIANMTLLVDLMETIQTLISNSSTTHIRNKGTMLLDMAKTIEGIYLVRVCIGYLLVVIRSEW